MKKALCLVVLILFSSVLFALKPPVGMEEKTAQWNQKHPGMLPIWMTPDEYKEMLKYEREFYPTDPPPGPVRNVAEFEPMAAVLIRYPLSIPYSLIAELSEDITVITIVESNNVQTQAINNFQSHNVNIDNCEFLIAPTDSEWTRDYGPWFIFDGNNELAVVNFPYNRPRPHDDDIPIEFAEYWDLTLYGMEIFHTGGNYMCDGWGNAASTTLVWTENTDKTHDEIAQLVEDYLGNSTYHVLPDPLGDYIEHIDCWGKFLDVDKVLIGQVSANDPRYDDYEYVANYFANLESPYGNQYQVFRVYSPGGYTYPTPYTNSLILNNKVFVPQTGSQYDDEALAVYETAMPGYEIIGVLYGEWYDTDALHCRTHECADPGMLYIHHLPILTEQLYTDSLTISAYIYPYSGQPVINDSLQVFYKIDNENVYNSVTMSADGNDFYSAEIPLYQGSTIHYYIHAADESGRAVNHPYIGAPDPHVFTVQAGQDTIPPTIIHEPFSGIISPGILVFNAEVTDNSAVAGVVLEITIDENETEYLAMNNTEGSNWSYSYDFSYSETERVVNYRITANDTAMPENFVSLPENGFFTFTLMSVDADDDFISKYPDKIIAAYPNPFSKTTNRSAGITISFCLTDSQNITADIFDLKGRKVSSVNAGLMNKGLNKLVWTTDDFSGEVVPTGIYFVRLNGKYTADVKKVLIIK